VGERFEATVGPVAHGGHCIVRVVPDPETEPEATRVVFTRHCLPGERVVVEVTEGTDGDRFWRADAVEVLEPSADRVPAPCPVAGPGLCGGCDFQHATPAAQRRLKAAVVREQLQRLAGLDVDVEVLPVAGDLPEQETAGLRWRTRVRFVTDEQGRRGMRAHRSRRVVPVDDCLIAHPRAREGGSGAVTETVTAAGSSHDYDVAADGFWQVHPGAPRVLVEAVLDLLAPRPGETVLDLYAGVGLFSAFLADAVGPEGHVVAVEGDRVATRHAVTNLPGDTARVVHGPVLEVLASGLTEPVDLVVLDPPREGARRAVVDQVVARGPRAVAYVACDPAALARDVAFFAEHGYRLQEVRAYDLFPMTHHVECVALLEKGPRATTRSATSSRRPTRYSMP
jgi:tRNA/tmRNA/rRNA uracil-C5-methylase (TrmA/RlmC/RlmD family)